MQKCCNWSRAALLIICLLSCGVLAIAKPASDGILRQSVSPIVQQTIVRAKRFIPQLMQRKGIPGVALALVDSQGIIWAQGFGYTSNNNKHRFNVTPKTLFAIQSQSKMFTALGVLFAVQQGLLSLKTPIVQYIPELTVYSPYSKHAADKITLTNLLSHTAGFMFDAPLGNNENASVSFVQSMQSVLQGTWLKFPVGKGYSYSNVGIDLAGFILQKVNNEPFADYMQKYVLQPLGMRQSTFKSKRILADKTRALGTIPGMQTAPFNHSILPAAGMYANVIDMAKYLQFQINQGNINGKQVLAKKLLQKMLTIPYAKPGQQIGNCLGVWQGERNHAIFYGHLGAGFGFASDLFWYPHYKIGMVVLTNLYNINAAKSISQFIMRPIIKAKQKAAEQKLIAFMSGNYISNDGSITVGYKKGKFGFWGEVNTGIEGSKIMTGFFPLQYYVKNIFYSPRDHHTYRFIKKSNTGVPALQRIIDSYTWYLNQAANMPLGGNASQLKKYVGLYAIQGYGKARIFKLHLHNGYLYLNKMRLRQYKKAIFIAANGDVLVLTKGKQSWRNLPIVPVEKSSSVANRKAK